MINYSTASKEFHFVACARVGWGKGDYSFFSLFSPAVRSQKILAVQSGGRKGKGLGEGIFARLFCAAGAMAKDDNY